MILLILGPSGIGKSYLADEIVAKWPKSFKIGPVTTTRQPRGQDKAADREFVSEAEFNQISEQGGFIIHDTYDHNRYGWRKEMSNSSDVYVTNIWPTLVPDFLTETNAEPILLSSTNHELLRERMSRRGDDRETIRRRMAIAKQDQAFLQKYEDEIAARGHVFVINSDEDIAQKVLPWIESTYLS